ncbi:MAG: exodeoxyribonuclease VII small subunit [Eggerthellaceae bacterium]|nr:exodeoxyribonuclease VII small subunit [Eggerthellaceae bacterium]
MPDSREYASFDAVRARLDEIVEAVASDDISLDDALVLYEEAVKLGLSACDLSEADVEDVLAAEQAQEAQGGSDDQPNS